MKLDKLTGNEKAQESMRSTRRSPPSITPAMFQIMLALSPRDLHGYAIMGEVDSLSGGECKLGPGTLYRSLQRMVVAGLIEETSGPIDPKWTDERRRYYRLTGLGRKIAADEAERLSRLLQSAHDRGLLKGE